MERLRLTVTPRIGPPLIERLAAALAAFSPGLISVEGTRDVFCEGLDTEWVSGVSPADLAALMRRFSGLCAALAGASCPTVALVHGRASGGGVALAAAADLVIAAPSATFALPEVYVGLIPVASFPWVARRIGVVRARQMALGAAPLTAPAALAAGLVDEIAPDPEAALAPHLQRWHRADRRALGEVKALAGAHGTPGYLEEAIMRASSLLAEETTRARIARASAGLPPWPPEEEED